MEVELNLVMIVSAGLLLIIFLLFYFVNRRVNIKIGHYDSLLEAISESNSELKRIEDEVNENESKRLSISIEIERESKRYSDLDHENKALLKSEGLIKDEMETLLRSRGELDLSINTLSALKNNLDAEAESLLDRNRGLKLDLEALVKMKEELDRSTQELISLEKSLDLETRTLQLLKVDADKISFQFDKNTKSNDILEKELDEKGRMLEIKNTEIVNLISKLDLYTRIDEFVDFGLYEEPKYLYETSSRFSSEIKEIRQKQRELIRSKNAVVYPDSIEMTSERSIDKNILNGQVKLLLAAFNIECDSLIGRVSPGNFSRTLERIEKLANTLEKSVATLHCGFNIDYINLKFRECQLQYQFSLKKRDEQIEQRLIREQIREEQRAIKEYELAIVQAEKEERMYRDMLEKAREELSEVSEEDRSKAEERIRELEQQLEESEAKEERAKSMAEQTRKGHVYVISNVGSFGDRIYKIGLTRRLEPMDRVKELGDASVPFPFDVHAMIYVDDAPALEAALHREFSRSRVNAVNLRKEFFNTDLHSIKKAVERISGGETEFKMTALAEDYYESRRLQGLDSSVA